MNNKKLIEQCNEEIAHLERCCDRYDAIGSANILEDCQRKLAIQRIALAALESPPAAIRVPVAYCQPDDPDNSTAFAWPGTAREERHSMALYAEVHARNNDAACDRHYIAGVTAGWNFAQNGDDAGMQKCIRHRTNGIVDADGYKEASRVPDGWISCSDRIPAVNVPALVFSRGGVVQNMIYGFDGKHWRDWNEQYDKVEAECFVMWMPLPAAPSKEDAK